MAGHSKWKKIKHKKAANDAKQGQTFTKVIKELTIAAKMGGSDPDGNPRLRQAIQAAKDVNMPKDNISRAIKKGAGELEGVTYQDFVFEGYGQGGVAILVEGTTDNINRTGPEIRNIFGKNGGNMGEPGCVAWMFKKKGVILIPRGDRAEDELMEAALESGAEDFIPEDDSFRVLTSDTDLHQVRDALESSGIKVDSSDFEQIPDNTIKLESGEQAAKLFRLIETLEEHDDVSTVSSNVEVDEAVLEQIGG